MGGSDPNPPNRGPSQGLGSGGNCPSRIATTIAGPAAGIAKGEWLDVRVDRTGGHPRVVLVDEVTLATVGSLAGIPDLATLIRCLEQDIPYRAYVDHVDGGRIDVTVIRG
ncbi:hypothetical protein [Methylorubrum sp. SB2]|uniref:hypothetical protein n=1 Tax=Methylorubrum subtropicum TaxID=3138812 RepID=UPI00313C2FBC